MYIQRMDEYSFYKLKFKEIEIDPPISVDMVRVGIDPGTVHLGIALLVPERAGLLYEIAMEREDTMKRLFKTREVLSRIFHSFDIRYFHPNVTIEGASYGDRFRQVELAEQRATIGLWFMDNYHCQVQIVPPLTITKKVFGSAKVRAWNEWPDLPKNAASALACAMLPIDTTELRV